MKLTVLKANARAGHVSYLKSLDEDLADAAAEEHDAPEQDGHSTGAKWTPWWKQTHLNLGFIIIPFRPFSPERGLDSASRYRLITFDIIYDISDLGMMSQFDM